ncbi:MAG: hypothetical protein Q7T62_17905 [Undibacterium sp.]|nr:hypothetical protein [Undibacterium sp.]
MKIVKIVLAWKENVDRQNQAEGRLLLKGSIVTEPAEPDKGAKNRLALKKSTRYRNLWRKSKPFTPKNAAHPGTVGVYSAPSSPAHF